MGRMVDQTGLNERLQQHTRRSGMLIGVSMAIAMALAVGAFTWIFFRIDPLLSDFTGRAGLPSGSPIAGLATRAGATSSRAAAGTPQGPAQLPTATALTLASPSTTRATFAATHIADDDGQPVPLRAGPSAASARIALLPAGTRLKFLDEEEQVGDVTWWKFQTERGDVGWLHRDDTRPSP